MAQTLTCYCPPPLDAPVRPITTITNTVPIDRSQTAPRASRPRCPRPRRAPIAHGTSSTRSHHLSLVSLLFLEQPWPPSWRSTPGRTGGLARLLHAVSRVGTGCILDSIKKIVMACKCSVTCRYSWSTHSSSPVHPSIHMPSHEPRPHRLMMLMHIYYPL